MVPKKKRVTKELFQEIMKNGRVVSSPFFVFRFISHKDPHYAFVAPKSVAKKAVDRNRLRRLGYSALRAHPVASNAGIFFFKKGIHTASLSEIKLDIKAILSKAHIM